MAAAYNVGSPKLRIGVNPTLSKVDNKPFRFFGSFESIRQRVNRVRVALAIGLPSDFRACTPEFGALLKRRVGDDETIVVKQVCHFSVRWFEAKPPQARSYDPGLSHIGSLAQHLSQVSDDLLVAGGQVYGFAERLGPIDSRGPVNFKLIAVRVFKV